MNEFNIFGEHDGKTIADFHEVRKGAYDAALMADGHVGYVMPIGGVAAYERKTSPIGVGVDIGCGNAAVRLDLDFDSIRDDLEEIADEIYATVHFGPGKVNDQDTAPSGHDVFEADEWEALPDNVREPLRERARAQLGTVGGGNHYVDVFRDETGAVWIGVHFGSRGLGFLTAHGFVALAQNRAGAGWDEPFRPYGAKMNRQVLLDLDTPLGHDYDRAMRLAGSYAWAGREWVCEHVAGILGGEIVDRVHNHHNYAWTEEHDGRSLKVVRKGSTPASIRSFIGGSMGEDAVVMTPIPYDRRTLDSTVHGSGRVMSRGQAKRELAESSLDVEAVRRGGGLDEAPDAYRRLEDVLAAMGHDRYVEHRLTPVIVCMAP